MNKPTRILIIISSMDIGGAETFLMKVFRTMDKNKIIFDFLVSEHGKCFYDEEIRVLGGRIFHGEFKSKNPLKSFSKIFFTVKNENYRIVFRCSEHPMAFWDLLAAKLGGARVLVIRSTNTNAGGGILSDVLALIFRPLLNLIASVRIAPSIKAGNWLFGEKMVSAGKVQIVNNGVEIEKFFFKQEIRDSMRKELNLQKKFVVGHVGRFSAQKNHIFLLKIFKELYKKCPNATLMLIGKGEDEDIIMENVKLLNLTDKVMFMGIRTDVNKLMMAMDVFVFPSLYEGMPNTIIEAQATGLPCIISDKITREVAITDFVFFYPLYESDKMWSEQILSIPARESTTKLGEIFKKSGYDIKSTAERLEDILLARTSNDIKIQ